MRRRCTTCRMCSICAERPAAAGGRLHCKGAWAAVARPTGPFRWLIFALKCRFSVSTTSMQAI
ncbi:hypothetical protein OF001_U40043 [Pseudomonas sp. OF001]|nr:hypothetical protein OF001_U40043 [Pseudomonas sp. OF001]